VNKARAAGLLLLGAFVVLLVSNLVTVAGHVGDLRPHGAGDAAPAVTLRPLDVNGPTRLDALLGQVVLIDFWATWCGPCRQSMPAIERLWQRYHADGLTVVSINVEGQGPKARAFAAGFNPPLTFPLFVDSGDAQRAFHVDAIPQLVLVDRAGHIQLVHVGGFDEDELGAAIARALRTTGAPLAPPSPG
jgi:thiol-disulfide isomerase/thioredoxin